ncbi:hypothetical protein [Burkholderia sp. PAMC 28687]|uniref:hypothetical protein n=1 Tax=Burkholderia sp. PAMC 28687 TaxID=1795874 RepID=UPI00155FDA6E|nr:hypothetical protein [Burkholderia sp. PAMC 28687]
MLDQFIHGIKASFEDATRSAGPIHISCFDRIECGIVRFSMGEINFDIGELGEFDVLFAKARAMKRVGLRDRHHE